MKPAERVVVSYLRLLKQLETLMARAEKKMSPASYQLLEQQAATLVDHMSALNVRHVELVQHLSRLIGGSEPPPSPPRRSSRPPSNLYRFTLHPPRRGKKRR